MVNFLGENNFNKLLLRAMLKTLFNEINNEEFFDEREISKKFRLLLSDTTLRDDKSLKADIMAFEFMENSRSKNNWGTYFGSSYSATTSDGKIFENPSIKEVDKNTIAHWETRLSESINPVLKARYSGLIWDFQKKITNDNPDISIGQTYIISLIAIIDKRLQLNIHLIEKIKRALAIALSINSVELVNYVKNEMIQLENEIGDNKFAGLWGFSFDSLIVKNKVSLTKSEEDSIISKLEQRLIDFTNDEEFNARSTEYVVIRLSKYYKKNGKTKEAQRVVKLLGATKEKDDKSRSVMQKIESLREMQKLYFQYGLIKESNETLKKIRLVGGDIHKEMKKITSTIEVPKEKITNVINSITFGTVEEVFAKIIDVFVPKKEMVINALKEDSKKNPFTFMISNSLFDKRGREVAKIGPFETDLEGHVYKYIAEQNQLMSLYLNRVFDKIINDLGYTPDSFLAYVTQSPVFNSDRTDIIEKGIKAYFNNDYIVCNHLLTPQIEEGIRNLIELSNGVILKPSNTGGFYLKTLEKLLSDDIFKQTFSEDYQFYFMSIFTDSRSWNLRNNLCHGISDSESFNRTTSERIIHCLLIIGSLRYVK